MKFSTRGRYALRFMIDLAQHEVEGPVPLRDVGKRQDISTKYLEQIVSALNRAGLIRSVRGNQGGYLLVKPASQYTAGEILDAVEGDLFPVTCMATSPNSCERYSVCKTIHFWDGLYQTVREYVDRYTLAELVEDGNTAEGGDYVI